jgi:hypothetical protein
LELIEIMMENHGSLIVSKELRKESINKIWIMSTYQLRVIMNSLKLPLDLLMEKILVLTKKEESLVFKVYQVLELAESDSNSV